MTQKKDETVIHTPGGERAPVRSWGGQDCEACGGVCESIKHPGQGCRGPVGATGPSTPADVAKLDSAHARGYTDGRAAGMSTSVIAEAMLADAVRVEKPALPTDALERKRTPLCTGLLDYFPDALTAVAEHAATFTETEEGDLFALLRDRDLVMLAYHAIGVLHVELTGLDHGTASDDDIGLEALFRAFPQAMAAIAQVSWHGNEKHNPGQPLHHARGKSMDHFDCIARHYVERGGFDGPMRHSACLAWRALAALQEDLEAKGAPKARGAK